MAELADAQDLKSCVFGRPGSTPGGSIKEHIFKDEIMLVLSRQKDESIIIGSGDDAIEVTIVDVRGDKVRLGINAPRSVSVHRKEIYEAIQREKAQKAAEQEAAAVPEEVNEAAQKVADELGRQAEGQQPVDSCHPVN